MKRLISVVLIIACFGVQLKHLQLAMRYKFVQEPAAVDHDSHSDSHEMHCRGICYYVKQLLETDSENGPVSHKSDKEERRLELYSKDLLFRKTLRNDIGFTGSYPWFSSPLSDGYRFKLLQPPRV